MSKAEEILMSLKPRLLETFETSPDFGSIEIAVQFHEKQIVRTVVTRSESHKVVSKDQLQ